MDKKHLLEYFKIDDVYKDTDKSKPNESNNEYKKEEILVEYINYFKNSVYVGLSPDLKTKDSSYLYKINFIEKLYWNEVSKCFCFDLENQEALIPVELKSKLINILNDIEDFQFKNQKSFFCKLINDVFFNDLKNQLEKELEKRNSNLDKVFGCMKERSPNNLFKKLSFYNKLIDIFDSLNNKKHEKEVKGFITYLKDKLILKKYLLIGNYKYNSTVEKPFILPFKFNFLIKDNKIRISPMSYPRVNKKYILFDEDYIGQPEFGIKYSVLLDLYSPANEKGYSPKDKWNNSIDFIIDNFQFNSMNDLLDKDIPVFEVEESFYHLYEAYELALKTINNNIDHKSCLLSKLLTQKNIMSQQTYNEQIYELNNYDFKGYLKENCIYTNDKIDLFGLNLNQKIFANKVLNFFSDSKKEDEITNIIALNGPPGTGKTTVLQTVVASTIVNSALEEIEDKSPPIIFGCSATNQAKNNIIGGFKFSEIHSNKDQRILYQRWINYDNTPIDYGLSLAADSPIDIKKFFDYMCANKKLLNDNYLEKYNSLSNTDYFNQKVDEILQRLGKSLELNLYSPCFKNDFSTSISTAKENLQYMLRVNDELLQRNIFNLSNYVDENRLMDRFNYDNFKLKIMNIDKNEDYIFLKLKEYCECVDKNNILNVVYYLNKKYNISFENSLNDIIDEFDFYALKNGIMRKIYGHLLCEENANKIFFLNKMASILADVTNNSIKFVRLTTIMDLRKNIDKRVDEAILIIKNVIDNLFKPMLFHLSMRYYEGLFIEKIQKIEKASTLLNPTKKGIKNKYGLLSCIFPVFVSTMHSLSNKLKYKNGSDYYSNIGFIDILLVDEAGQVSTETGAISLLLSKKALIVGDTDQIPPVYSINNKMDDDITNYVFKNNSKDDVWNTYSSSLMRVAQNNTPWHQYENLPKGLYLLEHNRCPIELISFCDELKYNNTLLYDISSYYTDAKGEPKYDIEKYHSIMSIEKIKNKKITPDDLILREQTPWRLITNNGNSKDSNNRINVEETNSILNWIDENYDEIKLHHNLKNKDESFQISKYIAVITPFKKQALNIINTGKRYKFKNVELLNNREHLFSFYLTSAEYIPLTVGTVHSLQGAEKPIVLFSNVYGDKDDVSVPFIDRDEAIINVAVSRAKQSFYVFANENFLEKFKKSKGATGKLYNFIKMYDK